MKSWTTRAPIPVALLAMVVAFLAGMGFSADDAAPVIKPIENLRFALERYPDGRIKTQLIAGLAHVPLQGPIEGTSVKIEFFDANGNVEGSVFAEECQYQKDSGMVTSDSNVRLERDGLVITGKGLIWNSKEQTVRILSNVKVVMQRDLRIKKR